MRKTVYIRILFLPILLSAWPGFTQQRILKIANKMFEQRRYVSAQEAYMKLIDRDFKNAVVLRNLGDSYYFNGQLEDAEKWLKEFIESYPTYLISKGIILNELIISQEDIKLRTYQLTLVLQILELLFMLMMPLCLAHLETPCFSIKECINGQKNHF